MPVPPTDAMPCPQEVTTAIHKTARALDNDDNIDNDNVDNAVVLPHANKGRTVLHSKCPSIHAGGSLSSCEISFICCCVIISNAVWAEPLVPSIGRLSINGN